MKPSKENMRCNVSRCSRPVTLTAGLIMIVASMGGTCAPRMDSIFGPSGPQAPDILTPTSTAPEIVAAINANTSRVSTYQADRASLTIPGVAGLPLLSGNIAVERPQRFRLRATTRLTGPEVDLGSNEERFWLWARRNDPPGIYTARHQEFAVSPAKQQLPIEPSWLIDALGMPTLDPAIAYQGPFPGESNRLELRAVTGTGQGASTVVYVIDSRKAWVLEQHRYDTSGSLVASVVAERFRYDPLAQVSYPEKITIRSPAAQLALSIDTGPVVLNAPVADGGQLWMMPQIAGAPVVDLAGAQQLAAGAVAPWDLAGAQANSPWPNNRRISTPMGAVDFSAVEAESQQSAAFPVSASRTQGIQARSLDDSMQGSTYGRVPARGIVLNDR